MFEKKVYRIDLTLANLDCTKFTKIKIYIHTRFKWRIPYILKKKYVFPRNNHMVFILKAKVIEFI